MNPREMFGLAIEHHQHGRLGEAEQLYRSVLDAVPEQADVLHHMGIVLAQQGRHEEALPFFKRALERDPKWADALANMANALRALGRHEEAVSAYATALEVDPRHGAALYNLGATLHALQRHEQAAAALRTAVEAHPQDFDAWNLLAAALAGLGRQEESADCLRKAIAIRQDFAPSHNNLGNVLQDLGRLDEAERSFRAAIALEPRFAVPHSNLGHLLSLRGRLEEAERTLRHALTLDPKLALAHANLGSVLERRGLPAEAERSLREALRLDPGLAEAHCTLGNVLLRTGSLPQAEQSLRTALRLKPVFPQAQVNLALTLKAGGRHQEAQQSVRQALSHAPNMAAAHNALGGLLQAAARLSEAQEEYRRALELDPGYSEAHSNLIFAMDLDDAYGIEEVQAERRRWYEAHARGCPAPERHANVADPERRLRVGYVSADFRRQSPYYLFSPVLLRHAKQAVEVFCYSGNREDDEATERLKAAADHWRPTGNLSDDRLAQQVRQDAIDILVDLSGHMAGNRLRVFARKPAPIQVTAWGYAAGTGLPAMDYFFADPNLVPPKHRPFYAEEIFDLPCCVCYEPPHYLPGLKTLPAMTGAPFTFGCINRIEKISEHVIGLWSRILAAVPASSILFKDAALDDESLRDAFIGRLERLGIHRARVRLMGRSGHGEHLAAYAQVDLGLDPFPHGGGVSTAEALWMGVPVVTRLGTTPAGRISAAILAASGLNQWIAQSDEEYVRIATQAVARPAELATIRTGLRAQLAQSAFGDAERYTRAVESAYRTLWRRWCGVTASLPGRP